MTQAKDIIGDKTLDDHLQRLHHDTQDNNRFIPIIVERLKTINPYKIILFGSYAYGKPQADSDIDLIVVLNQRGVARTYQEKYQKRMLVHKQLLAIEREVSLDTLVYTQDEWTQFLSQNSSFSKLINRKGVVLYEASHSRMAQ